jgi:hypothetical protein
MINIASNKDCNISSNMQMTKRYRMNFAGSKFLLILKLMFLFGLNIFLSFDQLIDQLLLQNGPNFALIHAMSFHPFVVYFDLNFIPERKSFGYSATSFLSSCHNSRSVVFSR